MDVNPRYPRLSVHSAGGRWVDRLLGGDRMQWEADVGPFPQHIGALLILGRPMPSDDLAALLAGRLAGVPALGRRPVDPGLGAGSWVWVDDDRSTRAHLDVDAVTSADRRHLEQRAIDLVGRKLSGEGSPWRVHLLEATPGHACAVVVVVHHVLADGLAALDVLAALGDGAPVRFGARPPSTLPGRAALVRDAWERRLRTVRRLPQGLRAMKAGWQEMGRGRGRRAEPTALNRPTGPRRQLASVDVPLASVLDRAHSLHATVNDVFLVAVGASFAELAAERGCHLDDVVVSVPVAVTDEEVRASVGNAVGAIPVRVPTTGEIAERISVVAAETRQRLTGTHGRSLPVVLAAFRVLSTLRLVDRFANHQRLVNTFATNLRGPRTTMTIGGSTVETVVPIVPNQGNQGMSFAAFSYAGTLTVSVCADPDLGVTADAAADALTRHLAAAVGAGPRSR